MKTEHSSPNHGDWRNASQDGSRKDSTVAQTSRKSTPDFSVENHFSIFLLRPLTPAADRWVEEFLPESRMTFGDAVVVEHRYISDLVEGIRNDGLAVV